jgi:proteic killer suppression protein
MIRSFASRDTEELFAGGSPRKFRTFQAQAERKLQMLDSAKDLNDLRVPPGNRLEKLAGDRRGQHSIRINDQWRICFLWRDDGPWDVEIVDYH